MPCRHGQRRILTKRVKRTKCKQSTNEQMEDAMEEVRSCKAVINEVARMYNVSPTLLKDKISGRVKHGTKPDPKKHLNHEEELATFLIDFSRKDVMSIAEDYARSKNMIRKNKITHGWWNSFKDNLTYHCEGATILHM